MRTPAEAETDAGSADPERAYFRELGIEELYDDDQLREQMQTILDIAPQDDLEMMLSVKLVVAHRAACACFRGGIAGGVTPDGFAYLKLADRLSRTFVLMLAALDRHRERAPEISRHRLVRTDHKAGRAAKSAKQPSDAYAPAAPASPVTAVAPAARNAAPAKSAKQPRAKAAPPRAPSGTPAGPIAAETAARAKSAKQPHAKDVPVGLGPRLEQLRQAKPAAAGAHADPEEELAKLSDEELLAIMLQEDREQAAKIRAEQANRESGAAPRYSPETYRALALADAALARANSAKQPQEKKRVPANTPSMVPAAPASPRPGEIRNMWAPTDEDRAAIAAANAQSEE